MTDLTSQPPTASTRPSPLDPELVGWMPGVRRRGAVFLDYDGTLTPIVDRPELAVLSGEVREVLGRLARLTPVTVVSGRDDEVVRALVALDELGYVAATVSIFWGRPAMALGCVWRWAPSSSRNSMLWKGSFTGEPARWPASESSERGSASRRTCDRWHRVTGQPSRRLSTGFSTHIRLCDEKEASCCTSSDRMWTGTRDGPYVGSWMA